jgi:hypothetical protein
METPVDAAPAPRKDESSANDELITIAGGIEIEVAHLDGSKESVKVRQIPISKIQQFVVALGNEAACIELYCDKPAPTQPNETRWADTLTFESANAILDKGQELNLPFLAAWFRRQARWRESQAQGAIADIEKKVEQMIAASRSGSSQPQSPVTTGSLPGK